MARLRSAPSRGAQSTGAVSRQALKEKTNTTRSKATSQGDDVEDETFVKDARPKTGRARKGGQNDAELSMAGGLGPAQSVEQSAHPGDPPMTTDELAKTDGGPPPSAKPNRRPPRMTRKVVQSEAQSQVLQDMKKRMQATARNEVSVQKKKAAVVPSKGSAPSSDALPELRQSEHTATERSEFSLSPSPPPPPGNVSIAKDKRSLLAQPGSAMRSHGTPAVETSILALKNFKRRPRQPSMLQMVQQRTASARPSTVNVPATEDPSVSDLEGGEDEEEFAPDAEGTPLHVRKSKLSVANDAKKSLKPRGKQSAAPSSATATRKRRSDEAGVCSPVTDDALQTKRRKATQRQHEDDASIGLQKNLSARHSSSDRQDTPPAQIASDVQVINSSPSTTRPTEPSSGRDRQLDHPDVTVPSTGHQKEDLHYGTFNHVDDNAEQNILNDTMAEPASSSPLPSLPIISTQHTDIMADPLTQISPQPKRDKTKKKPTTKPMTTASLQSLLPKRRRPHQPRHRKSEYDIDSESDEERPLDPSLLESDEDELSGQARRKTKAAPSKNKKGVPAKSKPRQSKAAPSTRKSSAPPSRKSTAPRTGKQPRKTYGRVNASDKENEDEAFEDMDENDESALPDTSISMYEAAQSKELEEARKKFADVDDWDMDFESMSVEEGRSSSQNWR